MTQIPTVELAKLPEWVPDDTVLSCHACSVKFGILTRKHHCRLCGNIFCDDCTKERVLVKQFGTTPQRSCAPCFNKHTRRPSGRPSGPASDTLKEINRNWNNEFQGLWERLMVHCSSLLEAKPEEVGALVEKAKVYVEKLGDVQLQFHEECVGVCKVIVKEFGSSTKTILPESSSSSSGISYVHKGIVYKVALDHSNIYGGDEWPMKIALHERKSTLAIQNIGLPLWKEVQKTEENIRKGLFFPLRLIVDYLGFRITCLPDLPIGKTTIVYGTNGTTIFNSSPTAESVVKLITSTLNLKGFHLDDQYLYTSIECDVGYDKRMMFVNTARLLPPEANESQSATQYMCYRLRKELIEKNFCPLSADAFSKDIDFKYPSHIEENKLSIKKITEYLHQHLIPQFAKSLDKKIEDGASLKRLMHSHGINMRHLIRVIHFFPPEDKKSDVLGLLWAELISRTIKHRIQREIRELSRKEKEKVEKKCLKYIIGWLNRLYFKLDGWKEIMQDLLTQYPNFQMTIKSLNWEDEFSLRKIGLRTYPRVLEFLGLVDTRNSDEQRIHGEELTQHFEYFAKLRPISFVNYWKGFTMIQGAASNNKDMLIEAEKVLSDFLRFNPSNSISYISRGEVCSQIGQMSVDYNPWYSRAESDFEIATFFHDTEVVWLDYATTTWKKAEEMNLLNIHSYDGLFCKTIVLLMFSLSKNKSNSSTIQLWNNTFKDYIKKRADSKEDVIKIPELNGKEDVLQATITVLNMHRLDTDLRIVYDFEKEHTIQNIQESTLVHTLFQYLNQCNFNISQPKAKEDWLLIMVIWLLSEISSFYFGNATIFGVNTPTIDNTQYLPALRKYTSDALKCVDEKKQHIVRSLLIFLKMLILESTTRPFTSLIIETILSAIFKPFTATYEGCYYLYKNGGITTFLQIGESYHSKNSNIRNIWFDCFQQIITHRIPKCIHKVTSAVDLLIEILQFLEHPNLEKHKLILETLRVLSSSYEILEVLCTKLKFVDRIFEIIVRTLKNKTPDNETITLYLKSLIWISDNGVLPISQMVQYPNCFKILFSFLDTQNTEHKSSVLVILTNICRFSQAVIEILAVPEENPSRFLNILQLTKSDDKGVSSLTLQLIEKIAFHDKGRSLIQQYLSSSKSQQRLILESLNGTDGRFFCAQNVKLIVSDLFTPSESTSITSKILENESAIKELIESQHLAKILTLIENTKDKTLLTVSIANVLQSLKGLEWSLLEDNKKWINLIFASLSDPDPTVRSNCLLAVGRVSAFPEGLKLLNQNGIFDKWIASLEDPITMKLAITGMFHLIRCKEDQEDIKELKDNIVEKMLGPLCGYSSSNFSLFYDISTALWMMSNREMRLRKILFKYEEKVKNMLEIIFNDLGNHQKEAKRISLIVWIDLFNSLPLHFQQNPKWIIHQDEINWHITQSSPQNSPPLSTYHSIILDFMMNGEKPMRRWKTDPLLPSRLSQHLQQSSTAGLSPIELWTTETLLGCLWGDLNTTSPKSLHPPWTSLLQFTQNTPQFNSKPFPTIQKS
eukprot:TRINITY_DN1360_c0_g1_i4.p1 TRINITY_DN1360_c0_g1~~TRINITY_DN1360_c0_g1_i4.p1  ORF type:complete len:1527 (-),score=422.61 TRINITY_DN1360_c0_g1_i4:60-4640(-)